MQETNEEVQFGDTLDLTLEKRLPCGIVTEVRHLTCKFMQNWYHCFLKKVSLWKRKSRMRKQTLKVDLKMSLILLS